MEEVPNFEIQTNE